MHYIIPIGYCKKDVTPLLAHWSYIFCINPSIIDTSCHWTQFSFDSYIVAYICAFIIGIFLCQWIPGTRPTNNISIEFEIHWNFVML